MKLVTFEHNGEIRIGVLGNGEVIDLRAAWGRREGAPDSLPALLAAGPGALAHAKVAAGAAAPGARRPIISARSGRNSPTTCGAMSNTSAKTTSR